VEEQRIIWLPKEMDDEGHDNVTIAPSEDVQRNQMELVSLPSQDEGEGN
jgi:hypothetical protein